MNLSDFLSSAPDSADRSVLEVVPAGVVVLDERARIVGTNNAWVRLVAACGVAEEGVVGGDYCALCRLFDRDALPGTQDSADAIWEVLAGERDFAESVRACRTAEGERWFRIHVAPLGNGTGRGVVVMHFDVTKGVSTERQLFDLAHFDALTGLPNHLLFLERLNHALPHSQRSGKELAVLAIGLDRWKIITDTLGHEVGDRLVEQAVQRLQGELRACDTMARVAGDEFSVILPDLQDADEAGKIAGKMIAVLGQTYRIGDETIYCGATIGIAVGSSNTDGADLLVRHADAAMLLAREEGRNAWRFHTTALNERAMHRLQIDAELRHAVSRDEFELYYQPKVNCRSGQIVGVEALLRWNHPERGLVPPVEFVTALEESGLISEVGSWALGQGCRQLKAWLDAGLGPLTVAINLSPRQLSEGTLCATVCAALEASGLPPDRLELEMTETALMTDTALVIATLAELRELGVKISVDDFGTGYSSLAYLKRFPLDTVKVDRSFVQDITADPNDASITRAVITMAHHLKLKVVAEGVETEGQLALLTTNHCDEIQGYLFSRPVNAAVLERMLREQRCLPPALAADGKRQRTLLLVDDEENILASLRRALRRDGYRILTANSGAAALDLLAQNEVDVIVSDQRMPNMTGVEFLRRVKTLHPDTVRIVLSGYTELQSITDAINEGAIYKFLTKPWDDELLRSNIDEAFRHKEMADENQRLGQELAQVNRDLEAANGRLTELLRNQQRQLLLGGESLEIVRDILHEVPLPIVGVDNDGLIVFANESAELLLGGDYPLLGADAQDRLPAVLAGMLPPRREDEGEWDVLVGEEAYRVFCRAMHGRSSGRLLLLRRRCD